VLLIREIDSCDPQTVAWEMLLEVSERVANRAQTIELPHDGVHRPAPLFGQQTPRVLKVAGYGPAAAEKLSRGE
jgi:crotonobetainyl-CoA:carnitine CoA-transferase CaiB-like acyl-CoA transferase